MYLVTGGAGFIGSNIVAALAERGERVIVCDTLGCEDKWRNLAKHELWEILPPAELPRWLDKRQGLKAVVHMGAISATTERDGDLLAATNITLSQRLWSWCSDAGIPFLYASSAATYGDGSQGFDDEATPEALARLRPLNGYGWSKQVFDRWVVRQASLGMPAPPQWAGLKFFNVYGPNEYHKGEMRSVAVKLFRQVTAGEPATLFKSHRPDYPDGGQLRDFVWVGDCVAVVLWLLENPQVSGLFNLGSGQARSFADLAKALFAALERQPDIHYIPMPEVLRDKYQYFTEARIERLRAAGFAAPMTALEEGVATYVRTFLAAADPYR